MSRFLRSLLCRFMGSHLPSPIPVTLPPSSSTVSTCLRCDQPLALWLPSQNPESGLRGVIQLPQWADKPDVDALLEAWRRGTAATDRRVPGVIRAASTRLQVPHSESALGGVEPFRWKPVEGEFSSISSTGAPAQVADSSTSTPMPSPGSPRSAKGSSR